MHVCMIQDVQLVQAHFSVRSRPKSHQKGGEFWFAKCRLHPWEITKELPSGFVKIALENRDRNSEFPIENGDFP